MKAGRPSDGTIAFVLFALVAAVVLRWLWSGVFLSEFHSDTTDTLLWAAASLDAGAIASPTFRYAYFIPFGGNVFMIPFLSLFGTGVTALRCGMTAFLLAFVLSAYALFRSLNWRRTACWLSVALVLTVASATPKMREIHFGHILYYSLGTLFFFFGLACAPDPVSPETSSRRAKRIRGALFALCMAWAASCGMPLLLYAVIPVLGAWILVRSAEQRPFSKERDVSAFLPGAMGAGAGLALFLCLSLNLLPVDYADSYGAFSQPAKWWLNLAGLPGQWILLLCSSTWTDVPIASGEGIPVVGQIALAVLLAVAPVLALFRIRSFSPRERMLVAGHWILAAEILFFWTFGSISDANWRLSPLVLSSAAVTTCLLRRLFSDGTVFLRRAATAVSLFLFAVCFLTHLQTSLLPCDWHVWRGRGTLVPLLESIGVRDGYCTDFWFSNVVTVLTDDRCRIREVIRRDNTWQGRRYNTDDRWFELDPERTKTVFVCLPNEEPLAPSGFAERFECEQFDIRNERYAKLVVRVYDGDCLNSSKRDSKKQP